MEIKPVDSSSEAKPLDTARAGASCPVKPNAEEGQAGSIPDSVHVRLSDAARRVLAQEKASLDANRFAENMPATPLQPLQANAPPNASINAIEGSLLDCLNEEILALEKMNLILTVETGVFTRDGVMLIHEGIASLSKASESRLAVGKAKADALKDLAELRTRRLSILEQLGRPEGSAGWTTGKGLQIAKAWAEVKQLSERAWEMNEQNKELEQKLINYVHHLGQGGAQPSSDGKRSDPA